jgi:hypothetical protein
MNASSNCVPRAAGVAVRVCRGRLATFRSSTIAHAYATRLAFTLTHGPEVSTLGLGDLAPGHLHGLARRASAREAEATDSKFQSAIDRLFLDAS